MPVAPPVFWVFIAGMATVITPCVLPVLPAVLSGSMGSRLRPVAIVTGMSITFTLMGVLISAVASFGFFAGYLRWLSILFITSMGAILFDDDINQAYANTSSSILDVGRRHVPFLGYLESLAPREGLLGGLLLGMSLGILWIPCVGPILGAVFAYVAESSSTDLMYGTFLLLIYSIGIGIPMLIIAYSGKSVSSHVSWFAKKSHFLKKLSGLVLMLVGLMMLFDIDKYLKKILLPYLPVYI